MSEEMSNDIITLIDEDGTEREFELIDTIDHQGASYVALVETSLDPQQVLEQDGELVILKIEVDENEEETLITIEDDDEYEEVADLFLERLEDYYEIEQ